MDNSKHFSGIRGIAVSALALCLAIAGGCASEGDVNYGKVSGAVVGGALGSLVGSGKGQTAAIVTGAVLGGLAGDRYVDKPAEDRKRASEAQARNAEYQRRLEYERQSMLQEEQTRKEIEEQRLYEQWKRERGY